jgi:hypothetical protein
VKRSAFVGATLLAACAAACGQPANQPPDARACVDKNTMKVVPEAQCASVQHAGGGANPFMWWYLGRSMAPNYFPGGSYMAPAIGSTLPRSSGSWTAPSYSGGSSTSRGGFGSTAGGSHSGGGYGG